MKPASFRPRSDTLSTGECYQVIAEQNEVKTLKPVAIVIEDDPSMLRALRRLISGAGFEVRTFDRPSKLLSAELPGDRACLVVDVHLPEMNGIELCAKLAAGGCVLPVIIITAHSDDETRALAGAAHPVAFLIKPFPRDLLLDALDVAMHMKAHS
jgi:FixJ family two-component response regulator